MLSLYADCSVSQDGARLSEGSDMTQPDAPKSNFLEVLGYLSLMLTLKNFMSIGGKVINSVQTVRTTRDRPGPTHLLPLNSHLLEVLSKLSSMLTQEPLGGKLLKSIR